MKEKILNTLSFAIIIVTILLIVIFQNSSQNMLLIASSGMILYGMCVILQKNKYGLLVLSMGLSILMAVCFYKFNVLDKVDSITFMICFTMFLLVLISFIFRCINNKKIFNKYNIVVNAKVIDLVKSPNSKIEYYQPIYEYNIEDKFFEVGAPGYMDKFIPKIGDSREIYVSSEDYMDVYFDKSKIEKIYNLISSLLLLVASLIIIITLFI